MDTAFLLPEEPPLAGVSDFRGRPVYRSSSGGWRSAFFLIVMEVAETLAYFGVSANLITYLTGPLGQSNASSSSAVNVWSGTASLMPLLGAFVADYWLGRYRSIILACTLYVLGYGMITLASTLPTSSSANENSISHPWSLQVAFFYTSLYLIALAQGPDMPCGLAFAADQFDSDHPKECAARSSLFNWWYFFVAIGTTVAVATFGYIQENLGWVIGFGALFFLVLCAFTVFLLGTPTYRFHAATLGDTVDKPKLEEAHSLLRLLPIWVACLAYGVVLAQVSTVFTKQGETLDCRILGGLELQPATLQTFGSLAGMLFLPIYDRLLVPALGCVTGNPSGLTPLQRVGTGLALSLTTMLLAALVEAQRLEVAREHGLVDDADATVPMSWAWLVPQYVMIGVADLFVTVGLQEFFYDQIPTELRSLALALYFGVIGVGSFISGALVSLIDTVTSSGGGDSWFADNLNRAHLDYFYWLLAGLSAVELTLYLFFTNSYVYRRTTTTASFGSESASFNLYYGVSANLITYMTGPLGHSNAAAAAAMNVWSGTGSLMPLLGAFLADSWIGRYRSIILACTLYILGYGMITLTSILPSQPGDNIDFSSRPLSLKVALFYTSLYTLAFAQGTNSPSGAAFAADQFDPDHPKECAARSSFFNWWYFSIAVGIAVAIATVSYIQENFGWAIGFGMLCAIMICAITVFLLGTPTYRLGVPIPGAKSPFVRLARSLATLASKRHHQQLQEVDEEDAKSSEAQRVLRLLPIWAACLAYGVVFAQIMTLFNKQGRTLDRRVFGAGMELPPAALQTFGPVAILVFVPIYDRLLVPALRSATGNPSGLTLLQRVGTGMVVSLAAMCVAALVEGRRLETAREHGLVDDASATVPMSWAWMVPQYVMIGVADVFAVVGMQEFFYDEMPSELRSLGLALFSGVMGIGSFISGALIYLIDRVSTSGGGDSWFADNLNRGHLDYFYWLLAGLSAAELALYFYLATSYVYNHKRLR